MKTKKLCLCLLIFLTSCSIINNKKKSILDEVMDSRKLLIGTTGDYAPFSYRKKSGESFSGIDIEMAKNLGKSLGVEVEFFHTSWKNLMSDLKEKKFHLAMSGISKKLSRQQVALFSKGYITNGKIAIARCEDKRSFKNLSQIDRKEVRVIVNPGGTNESFSRQNIKNASLRVFDNNNLIFNEIINNKADVMITDSVEVLYQSKKHQGKLCAKMKRPLTVGEIGVLIPRDIIWKEYIDSWLHNLEISGEKKRIFRKYISY
mgnify:CR=1 FL=1